ncbi:receptor-interacting serine/threonine-protein kinase 4-like [Diprion similis]|uniref:receptor-interacting serine/threonine-protein kinase 4-like n=1 Tax=Diprion similis TaxID=362088 RepID=UPI001EF798CE|nr:receptor-interacting serine/threonine-protein kinase 4-like [Diprion similis]
MVGQGLVDSPIQTNKKEHRAELEISRASHFTCLTETRMTGGRRRTSAVESPNVSDEEELIRLLGFAGLEKIAEFISTRSAMDLHYPTQYRKFRTPLTAAIHRGTPTILKSLLDRFSVSLDSTTTQPLGKTALMHASYVSRNPEVIRVLMARGANVQKIDNVGWNPLYYAIVGERTRNVECLIESGAKLESRDLQGRTPLMIAAKVRQSANQIVTLIAYEHHSSDLLNPCSSLFGETLSLKDPFILSNFGTVKLLLDHGANPKAIDDFGYTALRLAILRNKHELAVLLAEYETDVTCKPPTAIHSDYELAEHLMPDLVPIMRQNTLPKQRDLKETMLTNV